MFVSFCATMQNHAESGTNHSRTMETCGSLGRAIGGQTIKCACVMLYLYCVSALSLQTSNCYDITWLDSAETLIWLHLTHFKFISKYNSILMPIRLLMYCWLYCWFYCDLTYTLQRGWHNSQYILEYVSILLLIILLQGILCKEARGICLPHLLVTIFWLLHPFLQTQTDQHPTDESPADSSATRQTRRCTQQHLADVTVAPCYNEKYLAVVGDSVITFLNNQVPTDTFSDNHVAEFAKAFMNSKLKQILKWITRLSLKEVNHSLVW